MMSFATFFSLMVKIERKGRGRRMIITMMKQARERRLKLR